MNYPSGWITEGTWQFLEDGRDWRVLPQALGRSTNEERLGMTQRSAGTMLKRGLDLVFGGPWWDSRFLLSRSPTLEPQTMWGRPAWQTGLCCLGRKLDLREGPYLCRWPWRLCGVHSCGQTGRGAGTGSGGPIARTLHVVQGDGAEAIAKQTAPQGCQPSCQHSTRAAGRSQESSYTAPRCRGGGSPHSPHNLLLLPASPTTGRSTAQGQASLKSFPPFSNERTFQLENPPQFAGVLHTFMGNDMHRGKKRTAFLYLKFSTDSTKVSSLVFMGT